MKHHRSLRFPLFGLCLLATAVFVLLANAVPSRAADRDRLKAFLEVTGFDVALDSIALSAASAPQMLGIEPDAFGSEWARVTAEVFEKSIMRGIALDILEKTMTDEMLNHAVVFYASELGQRLVVAENASHMTEDEDAKRAEGEQIVADLVARGSQRLEIIKRMNRAIDATGASVRALQEIQFRFLVAASAAGVLELKVDPGELRSILKMQEGEMRRAIQQSALANSAYTYQNFSSGDLTEYVEALEAPLMARVYELLNAVQYEIMAGRFEVLASRMAGMRPGQDI